MEDGFILAMEEGGGRIEWREKQRDGFGVADEPHKWAVRLHLQDRSHAHLTPPSHTALLLRQRPLLLAACCFS